MIVPDSLAAQKQAAVELLVRHVPFLSGIEQRQSSSRLDSCFLEPWLAIQLNMSRCQVCGLLRSDRCYIDLLYGLGGSHQAMAFEALCPFVPLIYRGRIRILGQCMILMVVLMAQCR